MLGYVCFQTPGIGNDKGLEGARLNSLTLLGTSVEKLVSNLSALSEGECVLAVLDFTRRGVFQSSIHSNCNYEVSGQECVSVTYSACP